MTDTCQPVQTTTKLKTLTHLRSMKTKHWLYTRQFPLQVYVQTVANLVSRLARSMFLYHLLQFDGYVDNSMVDP
ncbi:hypothetical protein BLOT_008947 [Blomia tropicalis]|nr:hypothetical protein BLOT_008947 [Blomia tropicalis]